MVDTASRSGYKKTAIVTGGSRGIGKAIAIELLKSGFHVYICARTLKDLKDSCSEISQFGEVDYFQLDITDNNQINNFLSKWNKTLNVLINNAGVHRVEKLEEDFGAWEETINTNLHGVYYLTKGLLKWIPNGGSIINVSSKSGVKGDPGFGAYCASKHALLGLTKCWAQELWPKRITVNAICPGWVKTEVSTAYMKELAQKRNISEEELYKEISKSLDLGRFITPEEVAFLAAFLVSERARGITGQSYFIK